MICRKALNERMSEVSHFEGQDVKCYQKQDLAWSARILQTAPQ